MRLCLALMFSLVFSTLTSVTVVAKPNPDEVARQIDQLLTAETGGEANALAPPADDATFLRRAFLDLIGRTPTPDDVLAFAFQSGDDKRAKLVEQLLNDPEFGANWARYWRDVVMYRKTEERALAASTAMTDYLTEQFNQNKPWSKVATDFITAEGDVRENGKTALIMAQGGMPEDVTAEVSRIFLGIQIQCAQCHNHPTDRWQREQFHELAAFFPRIAVRPDRTGDIPTFLVTVNDRQFNRRPNANNRFAGSPEHFMPDLQNPSERGTQMQPVFFVTGDKLEFGARDADRRGTLAQWITSAENPWFAKAYVNRVWSELVGEGFYEPIDDLGPDRECSAPQTMDALAKAFTDSGYDTKWLYRTIMTTAAYQRETRARRSPDQLPFQANCTQRLRADQFFDALVSALDLRDRLPPEPTRGGGGGGGPYGMRFGPHTLFTTVFGFDPSEPRDEVGSSVQQALAVMNSPFINQAISARRADGLGAMLQANAENKDVLSELYVKTLSRAPSDYETETCLAYIREVGDRHEAFEDIQWSLINSTEFQHRK